MTTQPDYTGTLFWPAACDSNPFQTRHPRQGYHAVESLWATLCNLQEQAGAARRTTARELLAYGPAREAITDLIELGQAFNAATTRHGKRHLIAEAKQILTDRAARKNNRRIADNARTVEPGRVLRALAGRIELRRRNKLSRTRDLLDSAEQSAGFRRASGKWAGGNHTVSAAFIGDSSPAGVRLYETVRASGDSTSARSSNGKWSGNDSRRRYIVPADWIETVYAAGIAQVDDRLTLSAVVCDPKGAEAAWSVTVAKQSVGFDLKTETGFVVMFAGKIHFGKSITAAKKKCAAEWKPVFTGATR